MTLDERARLAVEDIQFAVDWLERETRGPLERFDRYRDRRQRNRRLTAGALAAIIALGALVFSLRALQPDRSVPATPVLPSGSVAHRRLASEGTRSDLVHGLHRRLATDRPGVPGHVCSMVPVGRPDLDHERHRHPGKRPAAAARDGVAGRLGPACRSTG